MHSQNSCCPDVFGVLHENELPGNHEVNATNVYCCNRTDSELTIGETRHCLAGKWEDMVLGGKKYEIRNNEGYAVVKYFGNDYLKRRDLNKQYGFKVNDMSYCVSKNLCEGCLSRHRV